MSIREKALAAYDDGLDPAPIVFELPVEVSE
jgi:hypothetical protein